MALKHEPWLQLSAGLDNELRQAGEEGRLIDAQLEAEIKEVVAMPDGKEKNARAHELFDRVQACECPNDAKEPSALSDIQALRPGTPITKAPDADTTYDKIYGGWLGRASGCLLGKPLEGWRSKNMHTFFKLTDNYPLSRYVSSDVPVELFLQAELKDYEYTNRAFINTVDCMPEDDDTNYTLIALRLIETAGRNFTPDDVAECWLRNLPLLHLCTAERVAYRNITMGYDPSESATVMNTYREWIGAQIRADLFGYVNPGNTAMAAEMAWRDASISHVKNGIYGEMWVAAMIAAAFCTDDVLAVIEAGLSEIPPESRLTLAIRDVIAWWKEGVSADDVFARIHARWDENNSHDWCHTISNAQIVAYALLYGEKDFERTLSLAVSAAFDTDCNGATAGSVLGVLLGAKALPEKWIAPLNDSLESGVDGFGRVKISDMASRTMKLLG
ncbi:MAG: ADP-ribosylglycohydrolase family protein [Clostridiales bacterium]|nr:ADP-ribosylglycohydrolase family protein [Clostridiales bacterium]